MNGTKERVLVGFTAALLLAPLAAMHAADGQMPCRPSAYRGWKSLRFAGNGVELQIVPEIGGRVIQFTVAGKELFWVNPLLAGKLPPPGGLAADGGWLNYGGDKLWPAPQGWENDAQWPGPPDAVLDGQPYRAESIDGGTALRLTSRDDPHSGIRFSRTVRPLPDRSGVRFEATASCSARSRGSRRARATRGATNGSPRTSAATFPSSAATRPA